MRSASTSPDDSESRLDDSDFLSATHYGRCATALLAAINANSSPEAARFLERNLLPASCDASAISDYTQWMRSFYRETQGIALRSVVPFDTASSRLTLTVEDEVYSTLHEIHIDFDVEKRDFIAGISVGPSPGDNRDRHPVTRAQCLSAAKNVCARGAASGVFSGAVLIARGADVLFEYACGEANKRYCIPNDLDTRFNLGSLNKMFTATAVAQLVERGRLKLTDTIDHFIDESWLPQAVTHGITVHHVLSHTSGLGSFFNDTFIDGSRARFRAIDDFKPLVRSDRPAFTPGAAFRYSNIGMLLAGVVIERVAGVDYFDHIRENIYGPCGMSSTDCYDIDAPVRYGG